jgi:hypothetical protein
LQRLLRPATAPGFLHDDKLSTFLTKVLQQGLVCFRAWKAHLASLAFSPYSGAWSAQRQAKFSQAGETWDELISPQQRNGGGRTHHRLVFFPTMQHSHTYHPPRLFISSHGDHDWVVGWAMAEKAAKSQKRPSHFVALHL